VSELQDQINRQHPYVRARYSSMERKREFLENFVRVEVLAEEARKRGYDRDPDVLRVMKQQMINALVAKEYDSKWKPEEIPDAEVERYYQEHAAEFNQPEAVRVSQIFTTDRAKAVRAAAAAKAAPPGDAAAFRALVTAYSEDEDSKPRGGDLTFFDRNTGMYPKPLVEAAFALKEVDDVSDPVQSPKGYHVLKLTQRRPGFSRPLSEVKAQIRMRLHNERRAKKMEELVAEMRQRLKVEVYEDKLGEVVVDPGASTSTSAGASAAATGAEPSAPPRSPPPR
jgi:peptidyl-prolyl cis-trans isomerase C